MRNIILIITISIIYVLNLRSEAQQSTLEKRADKEYNIKSKNTDTLTGKLEIKFVTLKYTLPEVQEKLERFFILELELKKGNKEIGVYDSGVKNRILKPG